MVIFWLILLNFLENYSSAIQMSSWLGEFKTTSLFGLGINLSFGYYLQANSSWLKRFASRVVRSKDFMIRRDVFLPSLMSSHCKKIYVDGMMWERTVVGWGQLQWNTVKLMSTWNLKITSLGSKSDAHNTREIWQNYPREPCSQSLLLIWEHNGHLSQAVTKWSVMFLSHIWASFHFYWQLSAVLSVLHLFWICCKEVGWAWHPYLGMDEWKGVSATWKHFTLSLPVKILLCPEKQNHPDFEPNYKTYRCGGSHNHMTSIASYSQSCSTPNSVDLLACANMLWTCIS